MGAHIAVNTASTIATQIMFHSRILASYTNKACTALLIRDPIKTTKKAASADSIKSLCEIEKKKAKTTIDPAAQGPNNNTDAKSYSSPIRKAITAPVTVAS